MAVLPTEWASTFAWFWTKRNPARDEEDALRKRGLSFYRPRSQRLRTVLRTQYGALSVLICSEMIESRLVGELVGRTDIVLVPSWNPDTASYDHLIQSVGLQLHSFVAIANNGFYSDCRMWAPRRSRWERDVCRLIERRGNDVVFADLPLGDLLAYRKNPLLPKEQKEPKVSWRPLPPAWP